MIDFLKFSALCTVLLIAIFGGCEIVERYWLKNSDPDLINFLHIARGIGSVLLLMVFTLLLIRRQQVPHFSVKEAEISVPSLSLPSDLEFEQARFRRNALWFINMRWHVMFTATILVIYSCWIESLLPREVGVPLLLNVFFLSILNVFYQFWTPKAASPQLSLKIQIYFDLLFLTIFLHFSGGIENPFFIIYIFHVIIAGLLLGTRDSYLFATVSVLMLTTLVGGEYSGIVEHYTIGFFPHTEGEDHASHLPLYVVVWTLVYAGVIFCTAYFTGMVMNQLKKSQNQVRFSALNAIMERKRLESVVDASGAGMLLLSKDCKVIWANQRIHDWFGKDFTSKTKTLLTSKGPFAWVGSAVKKCMQTGKMQHEELAFHDSRGRKKFLMATITPIMNSQGQVEQIVGLIQDITYRKAIEAQMVHSGKMATLGRVAAGITHEIGNPLSSIIARLKLIEKRVDTPFVQESVQLLNRQIYRIGRIVQNTSRFSRPNKDEWVTYQINELLLEIINILKFDKRLKQINLNFDLQKDLPKIIGVRDQMAQVFLNLGINAAEAMGKEGTLSIKSTKDGENIKVEFTDTGSGMTEEVCSRIFNFFFTTKENGTGLGLAISDHMVKSHGGIIHVESKIDQGTTFAVLLPIQVG
jgi:PAS domain S-box-containing protein